MLGIVIVTHGNLGDVLIETAEIIFSAKAEAIISVSIDLKQNVETLRKKIKDGIKAVNQQNGILILTDMFGGTPSNLSYSFLEEGKVEVISGVNLPILVKAMNCRKKEAELHQMAKAIEEYGKKSISLASDVLKGSKKS
jgi:mannose PTS system EIIA component